MPNVFFSKHLREWLPTEFVYHCKKKKWFQGNEGSFYLNKVWTLGTLILLIYHFQKSNEIKSFPKCYSLNAQLKNVCNFVFKILKFYFIKCFSDLEFTRAANGESGMFKNFAEWDSNHFDFFFLASSKYLISVFFHPTSIMFHLSPWKIIYYIEVVGYYFPSTFYSHFVHLSWNPFMQIFMVLNLSGEGKNFEQQK